jgi:glycosyltransferase involved in cell wall biosynthesis
VKIQIIEAFKGGHHTNYIHALLPTLRQALINGDVSQVFITVTKEHYELMVEDGIAITESCNIQYLPTLPKVNPNPTLKERLKLFYAMEQSIDSVAPEAIISTSADYDVMIKALFKSNKKNKLNLNAVGVFHYGYPTNSKLKLAEKIKQFIYEASWRHANWNHLLIVNPIIFESLMKNNDEFSRKLSSLPDPMPPSLTISKYDARELLAIPTDGVYIGVIGMIDGRKALPELLSTFSNHHFFSKCRLLLAGQMDKRYSDLIQNQYQHLVDSQRIIIINRHLSIEELHYGYAASDVISILQYRRLNLSANLLKAVSYDKPIIVDDCGYTGMMTKRFKLGYLCQVEDAMSVDRAMSQAIKEVENFKPSLQSQRLKQYHDPSNYANTIMASININHAPLVTWDWVCEGLSEASLD